MSISIPSVALAVYGLGAIYVACESNARIARIRATGVALAAWVTAMLLTFLPASIGHSIIDSVDDSQQWVVLVLTTIMVAIVMFAPLANHSAGSFARILALMACNLAFFIRFDHEVLAKAALIGSWTVSVAIVWWELKRDVSHTSHRLFLLYQGASVLALLFAVLCQQWGFDLLATAGFALAIMLRQGLMPFHSSFIALYEKGPIGIALTFSMAHLGFFAASRSFLPSLDAVLELLMVITVGTSILSALLGVAQTEGRRALAYLLLSQSGLLMFGLTNTTDLAALGALLNWLSLALASTAFALLLSAMQSRRGQLQLNRADGNFSHTPRLAMGFLLAGFASVGFPLTSGYIAEDILLQGVMLEHPLLSVVIVVAIALNGFNVLRIFFMLFTGRKYPKHEPDIRKREYLAIALLIVPLFVGGLFPQLFLHAAL